MRRGVGVAGDDQELHGILRGIHATDQRLEDSSRGVPILRHDVKLVLHRRAI
jgi:hypothetical protein